VTLVAGLIDERVAAIDFELSSNVGPQDPEQPLLLQYNSGSGGPFTQQRRGRLGPALKGDG